MVNRKAQEFKFEFEKRTRDLIYSNIYRIQTKQLTNSVSSHSKVVNLSILFLPERQVLLQEFNDGLRVSESLLGAIIELVEGVLEGFLSEFASLLNITHDLIVEHREVQGQAESDGVAGSQVGNAELLGLLVGLQGLLFAVLESVSLGVLGDVSAVVTDHLEEEGLGLSLGGRSKNVSLDNVDNGLTVLEEGVLNLSFVLGEGTGVLLVLFVLLNSRDSSDSRSLR